MILLYLAIFAFAANFALIVHGVVFREFRLAIMNGVVAGFLIVTIGNRAGQAMSKADLADQVIEAGHYVEQEGNMIYTPPAHKWVMEGHCTPSAADWRECGGCAFRHEVNTGG
jgi:hypothetical protein